MADPTPLSALDAMLNVLPPGVAASGGKEPENGPRLNPAFGRARMRRAQFDSTCHGLQAGVERKRRGGFPGRDFPNGDGIPAMFNYRLNRGRSDFDLRRTFGGNFSRAHPKAKGVFAGKIVGGWELQGPIQARTGPPFDPTAGFDRTRLSGGGAADVGERPGYAAGPGASVIPGDRERPGPRLRGEAFNVANHSNFRNPPALTPFDGTPARAGSAGTITGATIASRQIQPALKRAFRESP
jgi:hypothetical protein